MGKYNKMYLLNNVSKKQLNALGFFIFRYTVFVFVFSFLYEFIISEICYAHDGLYIINI